MDILILVLILLTNAAILCLMMKIITQLQEIIAKPKVVKQPGTVTDNFQKPHHVSSSTGHIIVPKSPTEIRNQNFKKIKEGVEYGDIKN